MSSQQLRDIFRAYDIRGEHPSVLNEERMKKIGKAYATVLLRKEKLDEENKLVIGYDARNSSPKLESAFIEGVNELGIDVEDLGMVPFGLCLYKSLKEDKEAVYITASHLPKGWNGVKFYHSNGIGWSEEENYKVRDFFMEEKFSEINGKGKRKECEILESYKEELLGKIDVKNDLDIVLDCGNGTSGSVAPEMFREAGFNVDILYKEVDGEFPNRDPGVKEKNLSKLKETAEDYDLGIAYDGDSDRMVLVDGKGRVLDAGKTSYVLLKWILENKEGPVIANVEVSRLIEDIAEKYDRKVKRIRVGHTYLFKETLEQNGCFGAESSGHYCVPFFLPLDDGISCSLFAAWVISNLDKSLAEVVDEMPSYKREKLAFDCPDSEKFKVVESLEEKYEKEYSDINKLDGVRVDFENSWVLVRASNTSPKIRLTIEADSDEELERLKEKFSKELKEEIEKRAES